VRRADPVAAGAVAQRRTEAGADPVRRPGERSGTTEPRSGRHVGPNGDRPPSIWSGTDGRSSREIGHQCGDADVLRLTELMAEQATKLKEVLAEQVEGFRGVFASWNVVGACRIAVRGG